MTTEAPDGPPAEAHSAPRTKLLLASAGAACWIVGLITLAIATANPVTLNSEQIQHSQFIVTATRKTVDGAILVVQTEWKHGQDLGEITIGNLDQVKMPTGSEFLVPLIRTASDRFVITPTSLPNEIPLIYPATEEATQQLQALLGGHAEELVH